jgi:hypothetical protein
MAWLRDKKLVLAKKARKGDTNYIHAQLLLAGQKVVSDKIEGRSHLYSFDCGCVRSYSLSTEFLASESVSACRKHEGLVRRHRESTDL